MPTFEAWLVETYGSDLSKITEIKNVPTDVTGTLDALGNCTKLEMLNCYNCQPLEGTSSIVGPTDDCTCT